MATGKTTVGENSKISIKWYYMGEFHRFSIGNTVEPDEQFTLLMATIRKLKPNFIGSLVWKDNNGDMINLSSGLELDEAIREKDPAALLYIYTKEDQLGRAPSSAEAAASTSDTSLRPQVPPRRPSPSPAEPIPLQKPTPPPRPPPRQQHPQQQQQYQQYQHQATYINDRNIFSLRCSECKTILTGELVAYVCIDADCNYTKCSECYGKSPRHAHTLFRITLTNNGEMFFIEYPAICNCCREIIRDVLYNCTKCVDLDVCQVCMQEDGHQMHTQNHKMTRYASSDTVNYPYKTKNGITINQLNGMLVLPKLRPEVPAFAKRFSAVSKPSSGEETITIRM